MINVLENGSLDVVITYGEYLNQYNYTADSYNDLVSAITSGKNYLNGTDAEKKAAADLIREKIYALVYREEKATLGTIICKAKTITNTGYDDGRWLNFTVALNRSIVAYEDMNISDEYIVGYINILIIAISDLI